MSQVEQYLTSHNIEYILHEHPPVFTCEEAKKHCAHISGLHTKNLFLTNKKKTRFLLVVLPAHKRADLKKIEQIVDEKKLTFGKPELLMEKLGLKPGSVSPFGLINDTNCDVEVFVDEEVHQADRVSFHPNRNTASLELTGDMFRKYLDSYLNKTRIIEV